MVAIVAHAFEARAAAGVARGVVNEPWGSWTLYRGEMWDIPLAVIRCGPGKVAAAAATQAAIQYLEPAVILSFGVAGSPEPSTETGTMVIAKTVIDVALEELGDLPVDIPSRFESPAPLREEFLKVPGGAGGLVLCWEGKIVSPSQRPPTGVGHDGPLAVDWESSAVAQVAQMWNIPWAVLKVISDHGEEDRLRRVAVAAKRPLQWAAEVFRRACSAYLAERSVEEEVEEDESADEKSISTDRETSAG